MKETDAKTSPLELLNGFLESSAFISPELNGSVLAGWCRCDLCNLDRLLKEEFGYTLDEIISIYRLQHARSLMGLGVDYKKLYKYCGFRSEKELELVLDSIAN